MSDAPPRPWLAHYPPGVSRAFAPPPLTLPAFLADSVARFGDRPALEYVDRAQTFAQFGEAVAMAADGLRRLGVRRGDRVALLMPNCLQMPAWFFAAQVAGAAIVHLSPLDAPAETEHKLRDAGARLLVTVSAAPFVARAEEMARRGAVDGGVVCEDPVAVASDGRATALPPGFEAEDALLAGASRVLPPPTARPGDLALLQYTGGTTGRPKGAVHTQASLCAGTQISVEWWDRTPGGGPDNIYLCYAPLYHILGLVGLLRRLREGALSILRQRFDVEDALTLIETRRISTFAGVPTMWIALSNHPGVETRDLSSLVYLGSGGAPLPVETSRRIHALTGQHLRGGWGMTETGSVTTIPPDWPIGKLGSVGIPLPGIDLKVVDADDPARDLPPGEAGELAVRGPNVATGYWNRPEETAAAFHDGWLLTGDVARMDPDGYFWIVDRKKDLIISGGFNVYPLAIENAAMEHPDVVEAMAIGIPDAYRGESAKLFVVLRQGAAPMTLDGLRPFLAERLGRHEMPRALEVIDAIPRTAVGKQSRRMMRDRELAKTGG